MVATVVFAVHAFHSVRYYRLFIQSWLITCTKCAKLIITVRNIIHACEIFEYYIGLYSINILCNVEVMMSKIIPAQILVKTHAIMYSKPTKTRKGEAQSSIRPSG